MYRWEDIRDELFLGRETAVLAAQDQLEARQAGHEAAVLASLDPDA